MIHVWRNEDIVSPPQSLLLHFISFVVVQWDLMYHWSLSPQLHLLPRSRTHGAIRPLHNIPYVKALNCAQWLSPFYHELILCPYPPHLIFALTSSFLPINSFLQSRHPPITSFLQWLYPTQHVSSSEFSLCPDHHCGHGTGVAYKPGADSSTATYSSSSPMDHKTQPFLLHHRQWGRRLPTLPGKWQIMISLFYIFC